MTWTCEVCGTQYGVNEGGMVNTMGLATPPPLCQPCANAWNDRRDQQAPDTAADAFEHFKRDRRPAP